MPRKKTVYNEPRHRPQRNMRAKKVFDPSDNYMPKKRVKKLSKFPLKSRKATESKIAKKMKLMKMFKKKITDNSTPTNDLTIELPDSLPNENMSTISIPSSPDSPVQPTSPIISENICFICSKVTEKTDLVDCPICFIKVHKQCVISHEPSWKFKLDLCPWLCEQCRKIHCSKCLEGESESDIKFRCLTCKVGLDSACYDMFEIKPLQRIKNHDVFICIPCLTLATNRVPEEEEDEEKEKEEKENEVENELESVKSHSLSTNYTLPSTSEKDDDEKDDYEKEDNDEKDEKDNYEKEDNDDLTSINSDKSYGSFIDFEKDVSEIPDVTNWNKYQVYEYLVDRIPKPALVKIIKNDIDGRALQLLRRKDIMLHMGLKLGHALRLYQQVRIIQTQSTFHRSYWE